MELLVLDHFFDQDIESLRDVLGAHDRLRVLSYEVLRDEALAVFPPDVTHGLEAYAQPNWEPLRTAYSQRLESLLADEFARRPFDAFVSPSDTFYYVRAAPQACHRLGVPFFVAQKETTISEHTMRVHSQRLREFAPPVADFMTVCSARHREFWLRAGADPERVVVTGQPRFDFFARNTTRTKTPADGAAPTVLFFSYHVDAYHPSEGAGEPAWARLHRETEDGLWELARRGGRVLVKPHPQQDFKAERDRIAAELGRLVGPQVTLVYPREDARRLITGADVVVGFQTTALFEALVANKPVVYTGWDEEAERLADDLIPFHNWNDVLDVARDPGKLADTVESARERRRDPARARAVAEQHLGPVDGQASQRTVEQIAAVARSFAARAPHDADVTARREQLARARAPLRLRARLRQRARELRREVGARLGR